MAAAEIITRTINVALTEEERKELLAFLEQKFREKQIEVHRTDSLDYKEYVEHQEALLRGLVEKLKKAS